jgi:ElaB/YqjD/DUF883 family membrane-anchored ribosome-binding protein
MSTNANALNQHVADFRKKASALGHDVEDLGSITKELAGDYYDQGMKKARTLEKSLEKTIGEHPLVSLLIAAGAGLVAGAYFNRR